MPRRRCSPGTGWHAWRPATPPNVVAVARRLAAERNVLAGSGASWPLVAMCASEIAVAACDRTLARALREPLEPFSGTGLALHSVGYFGTADRCLGKLAMALGDRAEASRLLAAAVEQERRRGASAWERRSVADLWAIEHPGTIANLRS